MSIPQYVRVLGVFIRSYWFWIALLGATNVATWVGMELSWRTWPPTDFWSVRMYLASGLLLFDNLCVLWWYADSTRELGVATGRQAEAAERQMVVTERQLALAQQEYHDAWLERWRENKPVVFAQWGSDGNPEIKNAGAGMAINVYVLGADRGGRPRREVLGALGSGEVIRVRGNAEQLLRTPGHVLIAEGVPTRTRRWNPSLNWQRQGGFEHRLVYPTNETIEGARRENELSIDQYLEIHQQSLLQMLERP
ncbi:MAG TPA: hypothetical protein VI485_21475 [Vicinamibacterales bacterium]|nr:hypothetical protein [Vicinamibacterales bacterium]